MQYGTSVEKCKEGLTGKLVKGGLEGAGLRTGENERRCPQIPRGSLYFLSYLFILENVVLAQVESQTSQTKLTAAKSGDFKASYASAVKSLA